MKMKKLLAMVLSTAMALATFAGCGQQETNQSAESKTSEVKESSTAAESSSVEAEDEEVKTVTWVVRGTKQEDFDKVMKEVNTLLEERYNLNLNLIPVEDSEIVQRVSLMITSNEEFDMNYTNAWNFYDNVAMEAYMPLNDLLENTEIGQKLMEIYPEGLTDAATINGNIYALPNYQKIFTQSCAFIPKDLAEKYELDLDAKYESLADLEPFMQQILENEEDIWALQGSGASWKLALTGDYFRDEFDYGIIVPFGDYTVKSTLDDEEYIGLYRKMNEYYHKGYIRSDLETVGDDTSDVMAGRYAIICGTYKPGAAADWTARYGYECVAIPFGDPYLAYNAPVPTMTALNAKCEDPEAALEMYYVMWTDPEIFNMLLFGLEGEHYTKVAEDRVELVADAKYGMGGKYGWQLGNQFVAWKMPGQDDDVWEETEELNANSEQSTLMGFTFDSSTITTELSLWTAARKAAPEEAGVWAKDFDSWLEETRQAWDDGGIDLVMDELQKQIDAWRAAEGK